MAKQYEIDEIRKLLVGTWHAEWVGKTGAVSKATFRFFVDGTFDQGTSIENAVYKNYPGVGVDYLGGYSRSSTGLGTYRIDDTGGLILSYTKGGESRRSIEIGQYGNELRMGEIMYTKRR